MNLAFGPCYARLQNDTLTVGNERIERVWHLASNGMLSAQSLLDKRTEMEWLRPVVLAGSEIKTEATLAGGENLHPVHAPCLCATLTLTSVNHTRIYEIRVFPDAPAIGVALQSRITAAEPDPAHEALVHSLQEAIPTGIEPADTFDYAGAARAEAEAIRTDYQLRRNHSHDYLSLDPTHLCFTAASFYDQTDRHNELVFERQWLLHPNEEPLILSGNLFFAENPLTKNGFVFLKAAPLPNARPEKSASDVWMSAAHRTLTFQSDGYETVAIAYSGGKWGRIAALQN